MTSNHHLRSIEANRHDILKTNTSQNDRRMGRDFIPSLFTPELLLEKEPSNIIHHQTSRHQNQNPFCVLSPSLRWCRLRKLRYETCGSGSMVLAFGSEFHKYHNCFPETFLCRLKKPSANSNNTMIPRESPHENCCISLTVAQHLSTLSRWAAQAGPDAAASLWWSSGVAWIRTQISSPRSVEDGDTDCPFPAPLDQDLENPWWNLCNLNMAYNICIYIYYIYTYTYIYYIYTYTYSN